MNPKFAAQYLRSVKGNLPALVETAVDVVLDELHRMHVAISMQQQELEKLIGKPKSKAEAKAKAREQTMNPKFTAQYLRRG